MSIFNRSLDYLRARESKINIIDVGCARGEFLRIVKECFTDIFSIGIDPLNHFSERVNYSKGDYNYYLQYAIDNINDDVQTANFFINNDDQASSLLEMDFNNLTDNLNERDSKYYIKWFRNLGIHKIINVQVRSLQKILNEYLLPQTKIHFLKIDAEGKDLDVVKSLGTWKSIPIFIGMECSAHNNKNIKIFKNGCHLNEILPYMESNNYSVFDKFMHEYDQSNLTQMCDIIFKNNNY